MKKTLKVLMMLGCFPMMLSAKEYKKSESLSLDKGWEFAQVGRNEWLPATVPGTVHQDLISHNKLPNPFYGMNEQKVQWVENEDWVYKTTFNVTDEQLSRDAALLILEGIGYVCGYLPERLFVGTYGQYVCRLYSSGKRGVAEGRKPFADSVSFTCQANVAPMGNQWL